MGCETCVFQCPAIIEGERQAAALQTELSAVGQRERGLKSDNIEWNQRTEQAIDAGTWTHRFGEQHIGFRRYAAIATQHNQQRRERVSTALTSLRTRMVARQERCRKGPRRGWLNMGVIGATVCRSAIQDDGLPNEG